MGALLLEYRDLHKYQDIIHFELQPVDVEAGWPSGLRRWL